MAIRYSPGVLDDTRHVSPDLWNANVLADLPVGNCDCGGRAVGQRITRGRRLAWATATCSRCGAEAALPFVDVPAPVAA